MRRLRILILGFFAPVAAYLLAALIGSYVPVNRDWRPVKDGVTVYLVTNGYHSGLILPVAAAGHDWSMIIRPSDLRTSRLAGNYMLFGWGDRDFFLNTPSWSDLNLSTVASAAVGSGQTLVHVDHLDRPEDIADPRPIKLSEKQYARLTAFIKGSLAFDQSGHPSAIEGYDNRDIFYVGTGHYSAFYTCNSWTADALKAAGVRAPLWTPFSGGVTHWYSEIGNDEFLERR